MATLETRTAALETTGATGAKQMTNVIRFIKPGHLNTEIQELHTEDGQRWLRVAGESEKALISRATSEMERSEWGSGFAV